MTHTLLPTFPPTPDRSQTSTPTSTSKLTQTALPKPTEQQAHASPLPAPLLASTLISTLTTSPLPVPSPSSPLLSSQSTHTDHILTSTWTHTHGWTPPHLHPYAPLTLSPLSSVLHYSTTCFEGLKAYRGHDKKLRLFRPDRNCARMLQSARAVALPDFDPAELQKLIEVFVAVEARRWLPADDGGAGSFIYIRPTLIGTGSALGVQAPTEALLFIVAVLFPRSLIETPGQRATEAANGLRQIQPSVSSSSSTPTQNPDPGPSALTSIAERTPAPTPITEAKMAPPSTTGLRLLTSTHSQIRAWPGGFGHAKIGANYAPGLATQRAARARGYGQILWLFGPEGYVTEAGAANFFVLWWSGGSGRGRGRLQLVTAPLEERLILEGVTRASVLELVRGRWGVGKGKGGGDRDRDEEKRKGEVEMEMEMEIEVVERRFTMAEVAEAAAEGRLVEAFACGTAFFIAPVEEIAFGGVNVVLPIKSGEMPRVALCIKRWLSEIMYGVVEHEWGVVVPED